MVCEEDKDTLLAAWDEEIIEQRKKELAVSLVLYTDHHSTLCQGVKYRTQCGNEQLAILAD